MAVRDFRDNTESSEYVNHSVVIYLSHTHSVYLYSVSSEDKIHANEKGKPFIRYFRLSVVVQVGGEGDEAGALVDGEQSVPVASRDAEANRRICREQAGSHLTSV